MRRIQLATLCLAALGLVPAADAQQKHKDPVLKLYLDNEFAQLKNSLVEISQRLAAAEAENTRLKQQLGELGNELRSMQNLVKGMDTTVNNQRVSTQSDFLSLKQDLANLRQELMSLGELIRRMTAAAQTAAPPLGNPAPAAPAGGDAKPVEGYISAVVSDKEVKVVMEVEKALREGMRLSVFRVADAKTQIGIIEVTQVLDTKNALASIIYVKPGNKFEFSDIVRPASP